MHFHLYNFPTFRVDLVFDISLNYQIIMAFFDKLNKANLIFSVTAENDEAFEESGGRARPTLTRHNWSACRHIKASGLIYRSRPG